MMIAEKTGWSFHYIRDEMAWINVRMMIADTITYRSGKKKKIKELTDDELIERTTKK